jgi:hypothetical protein
VYKTTAVIRKLGRDPGLESVTMTLMVYRNLLRDALFRLGKRVEIWQSSGKRMDWKIVKQACHHVREDVGWLLTLLRARQETYRISKTNSADRLRTHPLY